MGCGVGREQEYEEGKRGQVERERVHGSCRLRVFELTREDKCVKIEVEKDL